MTEYNVTVTRPLDENYRPARGFTLLRHVTLAEAYEQVVDMFFWSRNPALLPGGSIVRITRLQPKPLGSALYREWLIQDKEWLQSYKAGKRLLPLPRERMKNPTVGNRVRALAALNGGYDRSQVEIVNKPEVFTEV